MPIITVTIDHCGEGGGPNQYSKKTGELERKR